MRRRLLALLPALLLVLLPSSAAAFLLGLMHQALDNFGCLASQPLFVQARKERRADELREDLLVFVRRCVAYATTYRSSPSQPARLLTTAGPALHALARTTRLSPGAFREAFRPSLDQLVG
mgnify:CR=1 FL=1